MGKTYKSVTQEEFDKARQVKEIAGSDSTRVALEDIKTKHQNWSNITWPALYQAIGPSRAIAYQRLGLTPDQVIEYLDPMTVLVINKNTASKPAIQVSPKFDTTYVYLDDELLAKRIWQSGKPGKSYITGDGMNLNDYLKIMGKYYSGDSDKEFFDYMDNHSGSWKLKDGDYRKPGKVYFERIEETQQPDAVNIKESITTNPNKLEKVLKGFRNLFGFKSGGTINYLEFFK